MFLKKLTIVLFHIDKRHERNFPYLKSVYRRHSNLTHFLNIWGLEEISYFSDLQKEYITLTITTTYKNGQWYSLGIDLVGTT